jgi:hypothetical protein
LANFYSVIKGSDEVSDSEDNPEILPKPMKSQYLRFAFLTGVSKFAKTSIFSGLNNITDITLNPKYGNICGYTQQDIETSFLPYLDGVELEKLKTWYNGYNFLKDKVYNPYNILLFIQNDKLYKNYWFETGTPTFLIKLIKENNYFLPKLSNLRIGEELLNSFDVENIKVETLFFQTGYLTINTQEINEFDELEYTLIIPNKEVENSLSKYIIQEMYGANSLENRKNLIKALSTEDLINLKEVLFSLFASIPYNNYTKNNISSYEGYYASIIYVYFLSLGLNIIAEDVTNKGRIDLTVILNDKVYILEFKVLNSTPKTNTALKQIQEKKYHEKYLSKYNNIYQIGIIFNEKKRNIVKFDYKKVVAH